MSNRPTLPRGTERKGHEKAPASEWMTTRELAAYRYEKGAILLGKNDGEWIGTKDDRHLLTVAGSRAGKSSTCLLPNLKTWPSSILCIDPKGELATQTANDRARMGQEVFILDPFGIVTTEPARQYRVDFDPLTEIRQGKEAEIVDNAGMVAEALIVPNKGDQVDHWSLSAKNLLRGLILFGLASEKRSNIAITLPDIREMVTAPLGSKDDTEKTATGKTLFKYFDLMKRMDDFGGTIAGVGGTMSGKPDAERGSIISTAVEQTSFLDSAPMKEHLNATGGRLETLRQLKRRPTTIYLVLPAARMATHYRWLRTILTLALATLEQEQMALPYPVLFILEEFPQLGYMRQIEAAAGLMAGYGVKLWTVLQDLSQIKALYRESWETFIGNAGVIQAFGNADATTIEYISRHLGTRQITQSTPSGATPSQLSSGGSMTQENRLTVPLLAPFEVALFGAREHGRQFIMRAGFPPAYIERLSHNEVKGIRL